MTFVRPGFCRKGIKLSYLETFIAGSGHGSGHSLNGFDTGRLCKEFIKPATRAQLCSYVELLSRSDIPNERDAVGEAQVFISYAWRCEFLRVVKILQDRFRNEPDTIIWMDIFCNNQHNLPINDFTWWSDVFLNAVVEIGHTVMVLSPWNDPLPLTRAWCVWELFCTQSNPATRFEVALDEDDDSFSAAMLGDAEEAIDTLLTSIDAEKCGAYLVSDKDNIFTAIRANGGFAKLNGKIFELMRTWVVTMVEQLIAQNPMTAVDFKYALGKLYEGQGRYADAEQLFNECYEFRRNATLFGPAHPVTLKIRRAMAHIKQQRNDYASSKTIYLECLAIEEAKYGLSSPLIVSSLNGLANAYHHLNEHGKAEELYRKCLELQIDSSRQKRSTISTMFNLANTCWKQGRREDAVGILLDSKDIMLTVSLPSRHPLALQVDNTLANLYEELGRLVEAGELYEYCLARHAELLGGDHPHTLTSMVNLALYHARVRNFRAALPLMRAGLRARRVVLGDHHNDTILTIKALADVLDELDGDAEAEELYKECFEKRLQESSEDRLELWVCQSRYCFMLAKQTTSVEKQTEAARIYPQCVENLARTVGIAHEQTLSALENFAILQKQRGSFAQAGVLCAELVTRVESLLEGLSSSSEETRLQRISLAEHYFSLGNCYDRQGIVDRAEHSFAKCVHLRTELLGRGHASTITAMCELAFCKHASFDDAAAIYDECLELCRHLSNEDRIKVLPNVLNDYGVLCKNHAHYERAVELHKKCWELRVANFGGAESSFAVHSMKSLQNVHAIQRRELGTYDPSTIVTRNVLMAVYQRAGRTDLTAALLAEE